MIESLTKAVQDCRADADGYFLDALKAWNDALELWDSNVYMDAVRLFTQAAELRDKADESLSNLALAQTRLNTALTGGDPDD